MDGWLDDLFDFGFHVLFTVKELLSGTIDSTTATNNQDHLQISGFSMVYSCLLKSSMDFVPFSNICYLKSVERCKVS